VGSGGSAKPKSQSGIECFELLDVFQNTFKFIPIFHKRIVQYYASSVKCLNRIGAYFQNIMSVKNSYFEVHTDRVV